MLSTAPTVLLALLTTMPMEAVSHVLLTVPLANAWEMAALILIASLATQTTTSLTTLVMFPVFGASPTTLKITLKNPTATLALSSDSPYGEQS